MRGLNTTLILALFALILGIILGNYFMPEIKLSLWILSSSIILFVLIHIFLSLKNKQSVLSGISILLIFGSLAITLVVASNPLNQKVHYLNLSDSANRSNYIVELKERLASGKSDARFVAQVIKLNDRKVTGKIVLSILKDSLNPVIQLETGDYLYFKGRLQTQFPQNAPYQFNYGNYLKNKGIYGQISLSENSFFTLEGYKEPKKFQISQIHKYLKSKLNKHNLNPDSKAIILALLLGERQDLSPQIRQDYIDAGVIHILAVSGLHVGILMLLVQFLLKPLGNLKKARIFRLVIVLGVIWFFAAIAGFSPSVLRAATMFTFLQIGIQIGQRRSGYNALIASAVILLLIKPQLLFEVGFQLSYAAVFFIMWLYPKIETLWKPKNKLLRYYWQLICVSLAAQMGVLPLSLYYFHQFPGLFLIANIIVLPALGIILIYGIALLVLLSLGLLPELLLNLYDLILQLLNRIISSIAQAESFIFKDIYFPSLLLLVVYLLIFQTGFLLERFNYRNIKRLLICSVILPLILLVLKFRQSEQFYIINTYRSTALLEVDQTNQLIVHQRDESSISNSISKGFFENLQILKFKHDTLNHVYNTRNGTLLIIDSLGVYELETLKPNYILLTQSPKINLDRLIDFHQDITLIADASNYRSYVQRWEITCLKRKIPFHNTYEKGFYKIE